MKILYISNNEVFWACCGIFDYTHTKEEIAQITKEQIKKLEALVEEFEKKIR